MTVIASDGLFDLVQTASGTEVVGKTPRSVNEAALRAKAKAALAENTAYLATASSVPNLPTLNTQVQKNARNIDTLIRLVLGLLDETSGT